MTEESTPKRRRRDELGSTIHGERYDKKTLSGDSHYQNLLEKTPDEIRLESNTNRVKAQPYWDEVSQLSSSSYSTPINNEKEPVVDCSSLPGFYAKRRDAVCTLFQMMGSPEEFYWEEEGIVTDIMKRLMINQNSRSSIMSILRDILAADENEEVYRLIPHFCPANNFFNFSK